MIPAEDLLPILIHLSKTLKIHHEAEKYGLKCIKIVDGEFVLDMAGKNNGPVSDLITLVRSVLNNHSMLIPEEVSGDILLSHMAFLAPEIPFDLRPIIVDVLSSKMNVTECDQLISSLESA